MKSVLPLPPMLVPRIVLRQRNSCVDAHEHRTPARFHVREGAPAGPEFSKLGAASDVRLT